MEGESSVMTSSVPQIFLVIFFSSELYSDSQRKHKSQRGVKNLLVSVVLFGVCGFFATNTKGTGKKKDTQRIMSLS